MIKRRRFTLNEKIGILLRQASCPWCGGKLSPPVEIDHIHELALGGADEPDNAQFLHYECHQTKTNGTKATTAGSSKNRVAKTHRLAKARKALEAREEEFKRRLLEPGSPVAYLPADHAGGAWPETKRTWGKGRKIPSRPFRRPS